MDEIVRRIHEKRRVLNESEQINFRDKSTKQKIYNKYKEIAKVPPRYSYEAYTTDTYEMWYEYLLANGYELEESIDDMPPESEWDRVERSGSDEEYALCALSYSYGIPPSKVKTMMSKGEFTKGDIERSVKAFQLRDFPAERVRRMQESEDFDAPESYKELMDTYNSYKAFSDREKESGNILDFTEDLEAKGIEFKIYNHKRDEGCTVFYDQVDTEISDDREIKDNLQRYLVVYVNSLDTTGHTEVDASSYDDAKKKAKSLIGRECRRIIQVSKLSDL